MNTVDGVITVVSATEAMTTIKTSGPTERPKLHSIADIIAEPTKAFMNAFALYSGALSDGDTCVRTTSTGKGVETSTTSRRCSKSSDGGPTCLAKWTYL